MQMPVSQAPSGMFNPCQQAYGSSNSQTMQQFSSGQPPCGLYPSGLQLVQPQQPCRLLRQQQQQQQQQPLSAGTASAGARNPFAAMPRELRNSQLRSNLAAVAGAFSACSGAAATGRGASPPASAPRSSMVPPPPPPPQHQQQQWAAPAMQGAAVTPNSLASQRGMYLAASSGMDAAPAQLPVSMGMAGCSYATVPGLQQAYASAGPSNSSVSGPYSTGMSGAYTAPLPQPLQSAYLQQQQQQRMMMSQQADLRGGFYSDPLPYLGGVTTAAPAMPASQQAQAQAQQLMYVSQGMPCNLQPMEPASMPYAAVGGEGLSHAQLLLQKQQALQQLQAVEQMMLLQLLPDA